MKATLNPTTFPVDMVIFSVNICDTQADLDEFLQGTLGGVTLKPLI